MGSYAVSNSSAFSSNFTSSAIAEVSPSDDGDVRSPVAYSLRMVGVNFLRERIVAAQNHMAALLALQGEADFTDELWRSLVLKSLGKPLIQSQVARHNVDPALAAHLPGAGGYTPV